MLDGRALIEERLARAFRARSARVSASLEESPPVLGERPARGQIDSDSSRVAGNVADKSDPSNSLPPPMISLSTLEAG